MNCKIENVYTQQEETVEEPCQVDHESNWSINDLLNRKDDSMNNPNFLKKSSVTVAGGAFIVTGIRKYSYSIQLY